MFKFFTFTKDIDFLSFDIIFSLFNIFNQHIFEYVRLFLEFKYYIQHLENQYFNLDAKLKIQDTKFQFIG